VHYSLTSEERHLRSSLRTFLAGRVPVSAYEAIGEQDLGFDDTLWADLVASGWLDLPAMGAMDDGSDWPAAGVHMAEEFGRTLVPAPVELVGGFLLPLLREVGSGAFGLDLDADPFRLEVPAVCVLPLVPLVFETTPVASSAPKIVATADVITVSGRWAAIEFAASARQLFLPIELPEGWALARVFLNAEGVAVDPVSTIDPGRPCGTITLSEVEVGRPDVLLFGGDGRPMEGLLREALLSYFLVLDGKAVGAAEILLERTITYVTDRTQFGVPIGSFQAVKHRVADMATAIESARSLASYTAWQVAQRHEDRIEAVLSSRLYSADAYRRVCESAIQCHGGMGFTWEVGLHRWYRSAAFDAAIAGVSTADLARLLGRAA
jgi:acyl-CoA dehydrogenase